MNIYFTLWYHDSTMMECLLKKWRECWWICKIVILLLKLSESVPEDCPPTVYKSVAISIISVLCTDSTSVSTCYFITVSLLETDHDCQIYWQVKIGPCNLETKNQNASIFSFTIACFCKEVQIWITYFYPTFLSLMLNVQTPSCEDSVHALHLKVTILKKAHVTVYFAFTWTLI